MVIVRTHLVRRRTTRDTAGVYGAGLVKNSQEFAATFRASKRKGAIATCPSAFPPYTRSLSG